MPGDQSFINIPPVTPTFVDRPQSIDKHVNVATTDLTGAKTCNSAKLEPAPKSHPKPKSTWRCDVCNYETNVARNLRIHMTSEKHTQNMQNCAVNAAAAVSNSTATTMMTGGKMNAHQQSLAVVGGQRRDSMTNNVGAFYLYTFFEC